MIPAEFTEATVTALAVTAVVVAVTWRLMVRAARRRDTEHARRVIAARDAVRRARRAGGSHEACALTGAEELVWERYATRYAGLGQDVTRSREEAP